MAMTINSLGSGFETIGLQHDKQIAAAKSNNPLLSTSGGETDAVTQAFDVAARSVSGFVASDMQIRLVDSADERAYEPMKLIERAMILREQSTLSYTPQNLEQAIGARNALLISRGDEPMKASEEQRLMNRISAIAKEQTNYLDNFLKTLQNSAFNVVA
ncbi:hypothetical protein AGMMS50229_02330 [Campylobacterota bacterium]|nr:hypothetical protein AGMMS50229_02330 [Campylobacterota bacterium]